MPTMDPRRATGKLLLSNEDRECDIVAAGSETLFGSFVPDLFSAYAIIRFGKSLPLVTGPESISGRVLGLHPAVVARSFESIRNKQMNLGHELKVLGAKRDRIVGCVLQCAYPEEPEGGWIIPESIEAAPSITALATIFKQAEGVDKMLGAHLSGKIKMAVSMEFIFYHDQVGLYDPATRICYDRHEIPASYKHHYLVDEKGQMILRKNTGKNLVLAIGGVSGQIWFSGVGYTDRPAEITAGIDSIAAEIREGMVVCQLAAPPTWVPGMSVVWPGGHPGGVVCSVATEGVSQMHGKRVIASSEDPVLTLRLRNGTKVIRRSSSVCVKN